MIVAKFTCTGIRNADEGEYVSLRAVYTTDPEDPNHSWSKWTPSGSMEMQITNPDARGKFVEGVEYFLTLKPA
jgi:hypothetical protein